MSSPHRTRSSDGEVPPSRAIVEAIATREGLDATEIEPPAYDPLYTVVNPEALDELFRTGTGGNVRVVFEYEGYEVVVRAGCVEISELPADDSIEGAIEE
jgi:hypothetical protein